MKVMWFASTGIMRSSLESFRRTAGTSWILPAGSAYHKCFQSSFLFFLGNYSTLRRYLRGIPMHCIVRGLFSLHLFSASFLLFIFLALQAPGPSYNGNGLRLLGYRYFTISPSSPKQKTISPAGLVWSGLVWSTLSCVRSFPSTFPPSLHPSFLVTCRSCAAGLTAQPNHIILPTFCFGVYNRSSFH